MCQIFLACYEKYANKELYNLCPSLDIAGAVKPNQTGCDG